METHGGTVEVVVLAEVWPFRGALFPLPGVAVSGPAVAAVEPGQP